MESIKPEVSGLPLFRVRGAARELSRAGLLVQTGGDFKTTPEGIRKMEEGEDRF